MDVKTLQAQLAALGFETPTATDPDLFDGDEYLDAGDNIQVQVASGLITVYTDGEATECADAKAVFAIVREQRREKCTHSSRSH